MTEKGEGFDNWKYRVTTTEKGKNLLIWKYRVTMVKKGKNFLVWKFHVTKTKEDAYINNEMQLQNHSLTFIHKNKSLLSFTSILFCSPMAYNTTDCLDKLTCTDYVDFGKCQDSFGQYSRFKNDSNYLDVKFEVFKEDDKEFWLVRNLTKGEADFKQFMRLRNQLLIAAINFYGVESLSRVVMPKTSKDMDEQLKLAHKAVDIVDRANRKICVTLLRYNVVRESSYAQFWLFARNKEDEKFQ